MSWTGPHRAEWTPDKIERFWDWLGETHNESFFGRSYGPHIVKFARRHTPLKGKDVLDAGAGAGHLIEYLLAQGARAWGIEQAPALADRANEHLHGRPGFMGVSAPSENRWQLLSRSFDVVFATEVIEHLGDTELDAFFAETHRILRHGGTVIISTPHNEELDRSAIVCPDCGCLFHPMQHVRSWTTPTLSEYALSHGIAPVASLVTALPVVGGISRLGRLKNRLLSFTLPAESNLLFAGKVLDGDAGRRREDDVPAVGT